MKSLPNSIPKASKAPGESSRAGDTLPASLRWSTEWCAGCAIAALLASASARGERVSKVRLGRKGSTLSPAPKIKNGALFGEAKEDSLTLEFWTVGGVKVDHWPEGAPALTRDPKPSILPK